MHRTSEADIKSISLKERPYSETKIAPIRGLFLGILLGFAIIGIGLFFPPLLIVGLLALPLTALGGLASRVGACPNCGANVLLMAGKTSEKCPDCKHRLVLRDKRLIDAS